MSNTLEYQNYSMKFDRKGWGRIFVEKEEDIPKLEEIMKEIDEYEFNYYYPDRGHGNSKEDLIVVFSPENFKSVYVHKFDDMDMGKVMKIAWEKGIHCFVVFGKCNQYDDI